MPSPTQKDASATISMKGVAVVNEKHHSKRCGGSHLDGRNGNCAVVNTWQHRGSHKVKSRAIVESSHPHFWVCLFRKLNLKAMFAFQCSQQC